MSILSPVPKPLPTLPSRRHTVWLIRMTRCRFWWPTTIREAATPPRSTSPARPSPPMAAQRLHASPLPAVKAPLPVPRAIPLLYITNQLALGSPSGLTRAAAVKASAGTNPRLRRMLLAGSISRAFIAAAATTASPAGPTITQLLPFSDACTFPGTTSLSARALFR